MSRIQSVRFASVIAISLLVAVLAGCSSDGGSADESSATSESSPATSNPPVRHHEMSEEDISTYQQDLDDVGCWAGPVDGLLGTRTEAALREFQEAEGLTITGLFGGESEGALIAAARAGDTVCGTASTDSGGTEQARSVDDAAVHELEVWQHDLNLVGCWAGPEDGQLGAQTQAAIRNYQTGAGLAVTGQLDAMTEETLAESAAEGGQICHAPTSSTDGSRPPSGSSGSTPSTTTPTGGSSAQAAAANCQVNSHGPWPTLDDAEAYISQLTAAGFGGFGVTQGQGGVIVVKPDVNQQQARDLVEGLHTAGYGGRFYCDA